MLERFMKKNKVKRENINYAVTRALTDENGQPLEWTIKPLSTKEVEAIRKECTTQVPIKNKPGVFMPKFDNDKFMDKVIVESIVYPDLFNAELQDDYNVKTPEDLLKELVDNPSEYNDLFALVNNFNGFATNLADSVEEAKN